MCYFELGKMQDKASTDSTDIYYNVSLLDARNSGITSGIDNNKNSYYLVRTNYVLSIVI